MFNCSVCNQPTGPKISVIKIIAQKRIRVYYNLEYIQKQPDRLLFFESFKTKVEQEIFIEELRRENNYEIVKSWETRGWEIAEELDCCEECSKK